MDELTKQQLLQMAKRLEQVHSHGAAWVAKDVARKLKKLLQPMPPNSFFTPREFEILQHVANGFTNSEIASALDISTKTVQFHLQNIFIKTNTSSRTEAVSHALKEKLLT